MHNAQFRCWKQGSGINCAICLGFNVSGFSAELISRASAVRKGAVLRSADSKSAPIHHVPPCFIDTRETSEEISEGFP